jgi:hypothetical protein
MADVFSKAVSSKATKNGSVITTTSVTANYVSDQNRAISGVSENTLETKYENSFDDPTYYGGGGLTRGLLGYYRLEETSGVRFNRGTYGSSLHLTDNNTVGTVTGKVAIQGNTGTAAFFTRGNSEYLSLSSPSVLNPGDTDFSISTWFKIDPSLPNTNQNVFGLWGNAGSRAYKLFYNGANQNIYFYVSNNGTATQTIGNTAVSTNTWYNLTVVHSNGGTPSTTAYLNNSSIGTTGHTVFKVGVVPFILGGIADGTNYYNGALDDFAFWNKTLTADEVSEVYNSGSGKVLR